MTHEDELRAAHGKDFCMTHRATHFSCQYVKLNNTPCRRGVVGDESFCWQHQLDRRNLETREPFQVRLTEEEKNTLAAAAQLAGLELSTWIRKTMLEAATRRLEDAKIEKDNREFFRETHK